MLLLIILFLSYTIFSTSAVCIHPNLHRRAAGISVELFEAGGANVKAVVTNTGNEIVRLFSGGTILDHLPVKKVNVLQYGKRVAFTGIVAAHTISGLTDEAFIDLAPGESTQNTFDLNQTWDIDNGDYMVQSVDGIPYAVANSTLLSGVFEYRSNILEMTIAPKDVVRRMPTFTPVRARTLIQCNSPDHQTILQNALDGAVKLASNGASAALTGNTSTFQEYYRTLSPSSRSNVAARFRAIAAETSLSQNERLTTYYCEDPQEVCRDGNGIVAYTQPSQNYIANCPIFYNMTLWPRYCNDQTQASVVVHEMTHAPGLFSPGTTDNAYGFSPSTALSASKALLNADTYALYATAVTIGGC